MILSPPSSKVGIYLKAFDADLQLPLTEFQEELLPKNGCSVRMLTLNAVNKAVAFEMIYREKGVLADYLISSYSFDSVLLVRSTHSMPVVEVMSWFLMETLRRIGKENGYGLTRIKSVVGATR